MGWLEGEEHLYHCLLVDLLVLFSFIGMHMPLGVHCMEKKSKVSCCGICIERGLFWAEFRTSSEKIYFPVIINYSTVVCLSHLVI